VSMDAGHARTRRILARVSHGGDLALSDVEHLVLVLLLRRLLVVLEPACDVECEEAVE